MMEKEYDLPDDVLERLIAEIALAIGGPSVNYFLETQYKMIRIISTGRNRRYRIDNDELFTAFILRWS